MMIRRALCAALVVAAFAATPACVSAQPGSGHLILETFRGVDVASGVREYGGPWTDSNTKSAAPGLEKPSARKLIGVGGAPPQGYMEFITNVQATGTVQIELTWPADANAKGVVVTVEGVEEGAGTYPMDFDGARAGQWIPVTEARVRAGRPVTVRVDARPTTGPVDPSQPHQLVVDAIRFRRTDGGTIALPEGSNPFAQPRANAPAPPPALAQPGAPPPPPQPGTASAAEVGLQSRNPFANPTMPENAPPPPALPPPPRTSDLPASNPFANPAPPPNVPPPSLPPPAADPFAAPDPFAMNDPFASVPDPAAEAAARERAAMLPPPVETTELQVAPVNPFEAMPSTPPPGLQPVDPFAPAGTTPTQTREVISSSTTAMAPAATPAPVTRGTSPFRNTEPEDDGPPINFMTNIDEALARAAAEGTVVVVIFTSDSQASRQFSNRILGDKAVRDVLRRTVPVLLDFHENPKLAERFSVRRAPYTVVLDRRGFTRSHIGESTRPATFARELRGAAL